MKKLFLIISLCLALNTYTPSANAQSTKPAAGFTINLTAENAGESWVYISSRRGGNMVNIDSSKTNVFPVVLKGKQDVPEMLYLRISGSNTLIPVFTENSEFTVFADFEDPTRTKVEGSSVHREFDTYNAGMASISARKEALLAEFRTAQKASDEAKISSLEKKYEELDKEESKYNKSFVLNNKASFVTPYIIRRAMYYTLSLDELKSLVSSLDKSVSESVYIKDLNENIKILEKVNIGQKYTDIILPGVDGSQMKLSDYIGKNVVLVDFWASWCGPCRRENPNVVKIFQEYHAKGFNIVGVSFDTNEKGWKDAIQADKLTWPQMSDLKGWNSAAAGLYGVVSIPHTVLIDKDGTIIAKNLHAEELTEKLDDLLK